jgi:hypothetical protein
MNYSNAGIQNHQWRSGALKGQNLEKFTLNHLNGSNMDHKCLTSLPSLKKKLNPR